SGRNSAPSLVSVAGKVPHHWYQWGESCPIIGVSGGEGIVPHRWCQWGGGIVPHRWCQWGRNSASSLVSWGEE
ncbi:unnamed protein product, partial [Staurois parvus]